jgi:hypothetical protein
MGFSELTELQCYSVISPKLSWWFNLPGRWGFNFKFCGKQDQDSDQFLICMNVPDCIVSLFHSFVVLLADIVRFWNW